MSELINNSIERKKILKELILKLHHGVDVATVRNELVKLMKMVPYGEVVEVEQELISEGELSDEEVLQFCDIHTEALDGHIDISSMKIAPPGHPIDTFKKENIELGKLVKELREKFDGIKDVKEEEFAGKILEITQLFNLLTDVEKHYLKLENLLFPYLEKNGITGPPKVMWGKHDEVRELLKASVEILAQGAGLSPEELESVFLMVLQPTIDAVEDMIGKEEQILLPMSHDKLNEIEWYEIYTQTPDIGFCLYDPEFEWKPSISELPETEDESDDIIRLSTGSFRKAELEAILNTLPIDITFVDKNEKVKYYSHGKERIFHRSRAIINRDVKMCHPPSSVGIVGNILDDFKTGREDHAPFWIQMGGKFIYIEYFALRDENGEFLGSLEVSQDLTEKRALEGEQRILSYQSNKK